MPELLEDDERVLPGLPGVRQFAGGVGDPAFYAAWRASPVSLTCRRPLCPHLVLHAGELGANLVGLG